MTGLTNQTSYFIAGTEYNPHTVKGWQFISQNHLLKNIDNAVGMEKASSFIIYLVLLAVALLAIFDTQVLSIFRRQKEIGTFIALGMTRAEVASMFTVEGAMYAIFAAIVGSVYAIPLFLYTATKGLHLFENLSDGVGLPMASTIYPIYGFYLIAGTFLLVVVSATLVSFLPARKIAKMNPVNALKGKIA